MVGKAAVYFTKQLYYVAAQSSEQIRSNTGCNGIATVNDHLEWTEQADSLLNLADISGPDLQSFITAVAASQSLFFNSRADSRDLLLCQWCPSEDDFETVVMRWIMTCGQHDT